jgi:hypothetical protein
LLTLFARKKFFLLEKGGLTPENTNLCNTKVIQKKYRTR